MTPALESQKKINLHPAWKAWGEGAILRERGPWQWAMEERKIGRGASPLSQEGDIDYATNVFPWCEEPTDSAIDSTVTHTVLMFAAAMGKTDGIVSNIIGWGICEKPTNMMTAFPIEMQRDKFSRDVFTAGLCDSTPAVNCRVVEKKSRDTGNTISYKKFPGGSYNMVTTGSIYSFRGPRVGIAHAAEVDGMPASVGNEGDPVELLFKRCEGFADAVKIIEGTPTLSPRTDKDGKKIYRSRIQYWFEKSDQRKWHCPCRDCGKENVWEWNQIRWPKGHPHKGMIYCKHCDAAHDDKQRMASVRKGKWKATAPFSGVRGYWLNGINSLLPPEKGFRNKIHQFICDKQRAEEGMDPQFSIRTWKNTFACEVDDPEGETEAPPDWKAIFARREPYILEGNNAPCVPRGGLVLTVGVDVHKNRLEVSWGAYGRKEEYWGIMHNVLMGEVQDESVWKELERELRRTFRHETGATKELDFALVDGGKWPDWVYRFMQNLALKGSEVHGRVRACRGASIFPHPLVDPVFKSLAKNLKGHWVGGDEAKDLIYTRLKKPIGENGEIPEGYRHYPLSFPQIHFEQLTSERVSVEFSRGEEIRRYKNDDHMRNEALDCEVYGLAAFRLRRWNFDAIESDLLAQIAPKEEEERETRPARKRNWVTGN